MKYIVKCFHVLCPSIRNQTTPYRTRVFCACQHARYVGRICRSLPFRSSRRNRRAQGVGHPRLSLRCGRGRSSLYPIKPERIGPPVIMQSVITDSPYTVKPHLGVIATVTETVIEIGSHLNLTTTRYRHLGRGVSNFALSTALSAASRVQCFSPAQGPGTRGSRHTLTYLVAYGWRV